MNYSITQKILQKFEIWLKEDERENGTIQKYLRDIKRFADWMRTKRWTRENIVAWKNILLKKKYSPVTVNSMIAAVNKLFSFLDCPQFRMKYLRVQRRLFQKRDRQLTKEEYFQLVATARLLKKERLALLMESICSTGIRVSEVKFLTVEAAQEGRTEISLKGKIRTILLPEKLCRKLLKYAKKQKIASGEIFLTESGKSISRRQIWTEMKALCHHAKIAPSKVFPHNLRHLFARTFYHSCHDIIKLADILGHSSIETTRIYLVSTCEAHMKAMESLRLTS